MGSRTCLSSRVPPCVTRQKSQAGSCIGLERQVVESPNLRWLLRQRKPPLFVWWFWFCLALAGCHRVYSLCSGIGCAACLSCAVLRYEGLGFLALLVDWQVANLDESTVNRRHLLVKRRLYCSAPFRFVDVAHSPTTVTLVHLCQPLHPLVSSRNGFTLSCAT